jgi:hypothetical protein
MRTAKYSPTADPCLPEIEAAAYVLLAEKWQNELPQPKRATIVDGKIAVPEGCSESIDAFNKAWHELERTKSAAMMFLKRACHEARPGHLPIPAKQEPADMVLTNSRAMHVLNVCRERANKAGALTPRRAATSQQASTGTAEKSTRIRAGVSTTTYKPSDTMRATMPTTAALASDFAAQAAREWAAMPQAKRAAFSNEQTFIAYRKAELAGMVRRLKV